MSIKRLVALLWFSCFLTLPLHAGKSIQITESWELKGFDRPESVAYDEHRNVLYVSNVNGKGMQKNGRGYISKVSLDGKLIRKKWSVDPLHAPKGMAIINNRLLVADIDEVVVLSLDSGKIVSLYPAQNAKLLNDIAVDHQHTAYISDTKSGGIFRLSDKGLHLWIQNRDIPSPNGLYAEKDRLLVLTSSHGNPGKKRYIRSISFSDKQVKDTYGNTPIGQLDGIQPDHSGGFFLSDWGAGRLIHFTQSREVQEITTPGKGTADVLFLNDKKLLIVPVMLENKIIAYRVP